MAKQLPGRVVFRYVTVNPDRERHLAGDPQVVFPLDALDEMSPESQFQEVQILAQR